MPRDIRSYFTSCSTGSKKDASTSKRKRPIIISSDEEEEKKVDSSKKRSKLNKQVAVHLLSDSDDDKNVKQQKRVKNKSKVSPAKKASPKKVISLDDAFGSKPIVRIEAPEIRKKIQKLEAELHDDNEFEETLKQLDASQAEEENANKSPTIPEKITNEEDNSKDAKSETKSFNSPTKSHVAKSVTVKERDVSQKRKKSSCSSTEDSSPRKKSQKKSGKSNPQASSKETLDIEIVHEIIDKKKSPKKQATDVFEERIEKKKQTAALYQQYLSRGGARNPGSKEIPEGAENCLAGLSFLITGVLESLEREEADELIKKYGGRILHQVSRNTDYVVVGDQPGPSKLAKAENMNVKRITEDDLLELIATRPAGRASNIKHSRGKSTDRKDRKISGSDDNVEPMQIDSKHVIDIDESVKEEKLQQKFEKGECKSDAKDNEGKLCEKTNGLPEITPAGAETLVEKYRPKTMKQLIGQHGDASCASKLLNWLKNWHKNRKGDANANNTSAGSKNSNGAIFKAALLSGPPGIGKTTTVQVVCNELGFDLLEFNASDTRNKKLLKEEVAEIMSNRTMKNYFTNAKPEAPTAKHVLLMDEVDGMAGNEDRGGLQELINLIKVTETPIICICNDRSNPKMRTLANYTFELRFQKPRLEQIRGAMKSICHKEKINISTEDLDRLITWADRDIRHVVNHLAFYIDKAGRHETTDSKNVKKNLDLGPWDVIRKVFSATEHKTMTLEDKCDLFFLDYSIGPLFVQENYLSVMPNAPRNELLERVALSAESLALGDIVENTIRSEGSWSLLPLQAYFSSAMPGTYMSGNIINQINFPSWLGRNSRNSKFERLRREITMHARVTTGASKESMNLDYAPYLRNAIMNPLLKHGMEGVDTAVSFMANYHLLREDIDGLIEITLWPTQKNQMQAVDTKVKTAFTRTYNKNCPTQSYAVSRVSGKAGRAQASQDEGFIDDDEGLNNESDQEEDDLNVDKMIKAKKPSASKNPESQAKGKEKGAKRGRGRGRTK